MHKLCSDVFLVVHCQRERKLRVRYSCFSIGLNPPPPSREVRVAVAGRQSSGFTCRSLVNMLFEEESSGFICRSLLDMLLSSGFTCRSLLDMLLEVDRTIFLKIEKSFFKREDVL